MIIRSTSFLFRVCRRFLTGPRGRSNVFRGKVAILLELVFQALGRCDLGSQTTPLLVVEKTFKRGFRQTRELEQDSIVVIFAGLSRWPGVFAEKTTEPFALI
jgi:hypothetical protein